MQPSPTVRASHHPDAGILARGCKPGGGLLPRRIQRDRLPGQMRRRGIGQTQPGQHVLAHRVPVLVGEQLCARVGPALRRPGEDVAAAQGAVQLLQHADHVGVAIDGTVGQLGIRVDRTAPRSGDQFGVDLRRRERPLPNAAARKFGQGMDRSQHPLATRRGAQRGRLAEQGEERADRVVAASQRDAHRRVGRSVLLGNQLFNRRNGVQHHRPRSDRLHCRPQRAHVHRVVTFGRGG